MPEAREWSRSCKSSNAHTPPKPRSSPSLSLWLWLSLIALGAFSTGVTFAQQPASQQRGLAADTAYQLGEIDHINLFNGGLTLRIPMGSSYPVGPNLSLGLTLTYSSNGWDYDDAVCTDMNGTHRYHVPVPSPHTNAGFGWRILPGKIYPDPDGPRTTYISGDGGEHGLYSQLHPGYPAAGAQPDTWFTSDATYLRVRHYSSGTGVCTAATGGSSDCYQVEFPDGTVHELHDFSGVSGETLWLVTRMMDRFEHDHFVAIDYGTANEWRISDSHGRNHKVVFSGGKIARVELEAFDTATPAVTTLTHVDTAIDRQNFFPPDCDATPLQITVPLLTQVTLPDGSAFKMSYETESSSSKLSGSIESLRLPTGGKYAWEYERLDFVSQDPDLNGPEYARTSYAVSKKEMFTTFGLPTTKIGEWNYNYRTLVGPDNPRAATDQNAVPCFHTVTVTDPLGHATVNYFDSASPGVSRWQYGLPFRRCDGSGNLLSPPFLSQEIYAGDTDTGTRLRAIYVDYDSDGRNAGQQQEKNHRLKLRRVEYDDDPGRFKQVEYSDFDGLGHFRTMTTSGNFDGGESRTSVTRFNPASGTLLLDPENSVPVAGNSFAMPAQSAPWVLGTFDLQTGSEAGDTATSEFCFDTDTGFLERTRVRAGADRSGVDLLRVFDEEEISGNGTGRVATERSYGGDPGSLGTGSLCSLSLPTEPQSQMEHTYRWRRAGHSGGPSHQSSDERHLRRGRQPHRHHPRRQSLQIHLRSAEHDEAPAVVGRSGQDLHLRRRRRTDFHLRLRLRGLPDPGRSAHRDPARARRQSVASLPAAVRGRVGVAAGLRLPGWAAAGRGGAEGWRWGEAIPPPPGPPRNAASDHRRERLSRRAPQLLPVWW